MKSRIDYRCGGLLLLLVAACSNEDLLSESITDMPADMVTVMAYTPGEAPQTRVTLEGAANTDGNPIVKVAWSVWIQTKSTYRIRGY